MALEDDMEELASLSSEEPGEGDDVEVSYRPLVWTVERTGRGVVGRGANGACLLRGAGDPRRRPPAAVRLLCGTAGFVVPLVARFACGETLACVAALPPRPTRALPGCTVWAALCSIYRDTMCWLTSQGFTDDEELVRDTTEAQLQRGKDIQVGAAGRVAERWQGRQGQQGRESSKGSRRGSRGQ